MAKYILNTNIALRSWAGMMFSYYDSIANLPHPIPRQDFLLLLHCDGTEELPDSARLNALAERDLIHPVTQDGETLSEWQKYRYYSHPYIPKVTLEITERCNYNCLHCFNAADMGISTQELSLPKIRRILKEAKEAGIFHVMLTGGEPMLHASFIEILHLIREEEMILDAINTNGFFITEKLLHFINEAGHSPLLKISFDGLGFHDWMRGREGAEKQTLDAIRLCVAKKFRVMVQTNLNKKNVSCLPGTLDLLDRLGVCRTRIIRTSEAPRWLENAGDACFSWEEYFEASLNIAADYVKNEHQMSLLFWQFLEVDARNRTIQSHRINRYDSDNYQNCFECVDELAVCADGQLFPCLQMSGAFKSRNICVGDLKKDSLQKLLKDSLYQRLLTSRISDRMQISKDCRNCPFIRYCRSCPAISLLMHGEYHGRNDASCIFFRDEYHKRILRTFPGFADLNPIPDNIPTDYLKSLAYGKVLTGKWPLQRRI